MSRLRSLCSRPFLLAIAISAALSLAACGGSDSTSTPSSGSNPTSTPRGGNPTAITSGGGTPTATPGGFTNASCSSISLAAGIPGTLLGAQASGSPRSEFARNLSGFFENVLDEALGGVTGACFLEITSGEDTGVWVAFDINGSTPPNAGTLIANELVAAGANSDDVGTFSSGAGGQQFTMVSVTGLTVLGDFQDSGAALWLTGGQVVLVASSQGSGSTSPTATIPAGGNPTATPTSGGATPTVPTAQPPSTDLVGAIDTALRPALNNALGTTLVLGTNFASTQNGVTTILLTYSASQGLSGNVGAGLSNVVEGFGGTVDSSFSGGGATSVAFSGMAIGGQTVDGAIIGSGADLTISIEVK